MANYLDPNIFFGEDTLNIFTDASITMAEDKGVKIRISCPGAVLYNCRTKFSSTYDVIYDSTNNDGELEAIYLALQMITVMNHKYKRINIMSDSKLAVYGLKYWCIDWVARQKNGVWYSTSGPVKNQSQYMKIISYILNNNINIHLYHVRGHMRPNTAGCIKLQKSFLAENRVSATVSSEVAYFMINGNNEVDSLTRTIVQDPWDDITYRLKYRPRYIITDQQIQLFLKLVGGED